MDLVRTEKSIAARHECFQLSVGNGAFEHPESAIGMDPANSTGPECCDGSFDPRGNFVSRLDVVHFDVNHANADGDVVVDFFQRVEVRIRTVGEFENQMVCVQAVEKLDQRSPLT